MAAGSGARIETMAYRTLDGFPRHQGASVGTTTGDAHRLARSMSLSSSPGV